MDLAGLVDHAPGDLVAISGTDPGHGTWSHAAFVPDPLPEESPRLTPATYRVVADARAALAALDSTTRHLPNPRLLRRPTLQAEAQSTSALEGTYAPLVDVLAADEEQPATADLREVLNYVVTADTAFEWVSAGRALTVGVLEDLQRTLVSDTAGETRSSGEVRRHQVVVGRRSESAPGALPVEAARYVPPPPGVDLDARLRDLLDWMRRDHRGSIDPVVAAGMAHHQFEALHPFHDGNGRIGRLLVVVHLLTQSVLSEPTLTVSLWFEARRSEYYDHLLRVSTTGDWDSFTRFFAAGINASAQATQAQVRALVEVQARLKDRVRRSELRADTAHALVDFAVGNPSFTVRAVERGLELSYGRANTLVSQLVQLGVLAPLGRARGRGRRFHAPDVVRVLVGDAANEGPQAR